MRRAILFIYITFSITLFTSCSSSVNESNITDIETVTIETKSQEKKQKEIEKFNFKPYPTFISIQKDTIVKVYEKISDVWYKFPYESLDSLNSVSFLVGGYRVLVKNAYSQSDAENTKNDLKRKTKEESVYNHNYKIKAGNFTDYPGAKQKNFQMTQMGYLNTMIISDSVFVTRFIGQE